MIPPVVIFLLLFRCLLPYFILYCTLPRPPLVLYLSSSPAVFPFIIVLYFLLSFSAHYLLIFFILCFSPHFLFLLILYFPSNFDIYTMILLFQTAAVKPLGELLVNDRDPIVAITAKGITFHDLI